MYWFVFEFDVDAKYREIISKEGQEMLSIITEVSKKRERHLHEYYTLCTEIQDILQYVLEVTIND